MPKFFIHKDGKTTIKEVDNIIQRYTKILTQKLLQAIFLFDRGSTKLMKKKNKELHLKSEEDED